VGGSWKFGLVLEPDLHLAVFGQSAEFDVLIQYLFFLHLENKLDVLFVQFFSKNSLYLSDQMG
jgi:hypothetical protein